MPEVYVNSFCQISVQNPLSDNWTIEPKCFEGKKLVELCDPDYKKYFSSSVLRRNGNLLRRAMLVSQTAVEMSGLQGVDAVITGTGLGAVENTEAFLKQLIYSGEEFLKPSYFMQSTHNTASSAVAIHLKCNGYNSTYCQKSLSFESAMLDAFLQISGSEIKSAFVGGFDEVTPDYFTILEKQGYLGGAMSGFAASSAAGGVLSCVKNSEAHCKVASVNMVYCSNNKDLIDAFEKTLTESGIKKNELTAIVSGMDGMPANDEVYLQNLCQLGVSCPILKVSHIFGECYTASAYAFYAAVECFKAEKIFSVLTAGNELVNPQNILLYRHCNNKNHSFILLKKC